MAVPKQGKKLTGKEQSERFKKAVRDLVDAGELNSTDADAMLDKMVKEAARKP
jgi:polyhydroxyalkanoate synthesis regulator phasin